MWVGLIIIVVVVGGWLAVMAYQSHVDRAERVAKLQAAADERGWHYAEGASSVADRFRGEPFDTGQNRRCADVLSGTHRGRAFTAFQYSYEKGGGSDSRGKTVVLTVAAVAMPAPTPPLQVGPEGWRGKLLGYVGVHDLQLESDEFNDMFRVVTGDDRFAYDVLHPRMMAWLIDSPRADYTPFRLAGGEVVAWYEHEFDAYTVEWMLGYLCDILEKVPDHVWRSG